MMINVMPKKVNSSDKLKIDATFCHQGVNYCERYRTKGHFSNALKRKKDMFVSLVDLNEMKVVKRDDLASYLSNKNKK